MAQAAAGRGKAWGTPPRVGHMARRIKPFHERFALEVGLDQARQNFVARAHNRIFEEIFYRERDAYGQEILVSVADAVGKRVRHGDSLSYHLGDDFITVLRALEAMYSVASIAGCAHELDAAIEYLLRNTELDLGIRWTPPVFIRSGAR